MSLLYNGVFLRVNTSFILAWLHYLGDKTGGTLWGGGHQGLLCNFQTTIFVLLPWEFSHSSTLWWREIVCTNSIVIMNYVQACSVTECCAHGTVVLCAAIKEPHVKLLKHNIHSSERDITADYYLEEDEVDLIWSEMDPCECSKSEYSLCHRVWTNCILFFTAELIDLHLYVFVAGTCSCAESCTCTNCSCKSCKKSKLYSFF